MHITQLGDDALLDREAAAALLQVNPKTLDRWHAKRIGPARILLGPKLVRYRRQALIDFARANEVAQPRARAVAA